MRKILEISTEKGKLREGQLVTYKGDEDVQVYKINSVDSFRAFFPSEDGTIINIDISDEELSF